MSSYYYLAAQLPYLTYGQSVPMSSATFRELAQQHLSSRDAAALEQCVLEPRLTPSATLDEAGTAPSVSSPFVKSWKEWETTLRLNLARNRAKKLGRDLRFPAETGSPSETKFSGDVPDTPFDAVSAARAAFAFESPLEAEVFLDKARWDAIESFQGLDAFSDNAIFAYKLKLLLMERRMAFNTEEGFTEYKGLYAAILGDQK